MELHGGRLQKGRKTGATGQALRQSLQLGLSARNNEILTQGVMNKDKPVECLMLVTRLFATDTAFLSETKSVEALDTLLRLASEEARRGKLPLGPRGWGALLEHCAACPAPQPNIERVK